MTENLQIEIYNSFSTKIEKLWRAFEKDTLWFPFQTFGWLSHWQKSVGAPLHQIIPQIVVLKDYGNLVGILPLGICKKNGIKVLEWLGGIHADYMGPLLHKDFSKYINDFNKHWKEIRKLLNPFDVIHFQRQPGIIGSFENPFVTNFPVSHINNAYQTSIEGNWEEFYNSKIKKDLRTDSRRQYRRLEEKGKLYFKIAASDNEAKVIIENMIVQKSQRYRDTGVSDMLSVQEHRDFYFGLVGIPLGMFNLHCSALIVDDTMIATHVGIIDEKCFYYLMPAHESGEWQRYSPGRLLLEHLLRWSFESGINIFDFTIGKEQYKKYWCNKETKLFEYTEPINFKGKCYSFYQSIINRLIHYPNLWQLLRRIKSFFSYSLKF